MALYIDRGLVPFFFLIIFPPSCKMYDTCCPSFFFCFNHGARGGWAKMFFSFAGRISAHHETLSGEAYHTFTHKHHKRNNITRRKMRVKKMRRSSCWCVCFKKKKTVMKTRQAECGTLALSNTHFRFPVLGKLLRRWEIADKKFTLVSQVVGEPADLLK